MCEPVGEPLTLPPAAQAPSAARRYVRERLAQCRATDVQASAELGVSELATNVVLHGRTPLTITVLKVADDRVRIEVSDRSPLTPHIRQLSTSTTTGRGLRLVAALSLDWGIRPLPADKGVGKTIWFEPAPELAESAYLDADLLAEIDGL